MALGFTGDHTTFADNVIGNLVTRTASPSSQNSTRIRGLGSPALFWVLCIFVGVVPLVWTRYVYMSFDTPKMSLFFLAVSMGITLWALGLERSCCIGLPRASGDRAGLAFLALTLLSLAWAYSPAEAFVTVIRFLALGTFYSLLLYATNTKACINTLLDFLLSATWIVAAYGLLQFYDMFNYPGQARPFLMSTIGHPNHASDLVGIAFPVFIARLATSRGWARCLSFAGACLGLAFILVAQARSVWIATLAALVIGTILICMSPPSRDLLRQSRNALIILLATLIAVVVIFSFKNPLNRRIAIWSRAAGLAAAESSEHLTVGSRMVVWKATWLMIRDHPLLGVGIGNFRAFSSEYVARVRETGSWVDPRYPTDFFTEAHNDYLQFLAEMGPTGLVALLWFIGWHLALALRRLRQIEVPGPEAFRLAGLVAAVLVFLVDALFSLPFSMLNSSVAAIVVLVSIRRLAAANGEQFSLRGNSQANGEISSSPQRGFRIGARPLLIGAIGLSMLGSGWAAATFLADAYLDRGQQALRDNRYPEALHWYEKAVRANPLEWRNQLGRAVGYTMVSRYEEALLALRRTEGFVKRATTAERMGLSYAGLGDVNRAEAEYRRAIWYEPRDASAWDGLVTLLLDQNRYADVAKEATEGVRWNPDYGRLHLHLAMAQAALRQEARALESAQNARDLLPSDRFVFTLLRNLGLHAGRTDVVEAAGRRLRAIGQYEESKQLQIPGAVNPQAVTLLLNAMAFDPEYADPHFEMGMIKRSQGAAQEAIMEFSIYLRLAPHGERSTVASRLIETTENPSWLARISGIDGRFTRSR